MSCGASTMSPLQSTTTRGRRQSVCPLLRQGTAHRDVITYHPNNYQTVIAGEENGTQDNLNITYTRFLLLLFLPTYPQHRQISVTHLLTDLLAFHQRYSPGITWSQQLLGHDIFALSWKLISVHSCIAIVRNVYYHSLVFTISSLK